MYFALVRGMKAEYMHLFQQRRRKDFPIAVVQARDIDDLANILKGERISSFEDEYEIFLPPDLSLEDYYIGSVRLEISTHGVTLWAKAVPVLNDLN